MMRFAQKCRANAWLLAAILVLGGLTAPAAAQSVETIDPDVMIDGDLEAQPVDDRYGPVEEPAELDPVPQSSQPTSRYANEVLDLPPEEGESYAAPEDVPGLTGEEVAGEGDGTTYQQEELVGAAEGIFGDEAEGFARMIERILDDQGEPNGYIVGNETGGAVIFGVRYGSGTLFHAIEGNMPIYWTGPSIGVDFGVNGGNTFVLVYNVFDTEELYERFPATEGQVYLIGGFHASYLRKGDIVLIPIRVGAGLRLGFNGGYMKFSRKARWLPF